MTNVIKLARTDEQRACKQFEPEACLDECPAVCPRTFSIDLKPYPHIDLDLDVILYAYPVINKEQARSKQSEQDFQARCVRMLEKLEGRSNKRRSFDTVLGIYNESLCRFRQVTVDHKNPTPEETRLSRVIEGDRGFIKIEVIPQKRGRKPRTQDSFMVEECLRIWQRAGGVNINLSLIGGEAVDPFFDFVKAVIKYTGARRMTDKSISDQYRKLD